ncbi:hypothetical protein [Acanthamoeba castellanii mimivirus]|jgi:hypothetical protein|nr:hypothetical protein MIMI_R692 [Acanthamoeba polyphaga mimivirus]AEQ60902.1 hypothetical protein [Acanthamoeba castellanii mamavirus]AHJ40320.2 hypothetical protein [Samba virus]AMZ03136.1 hypothetical protein [Mimivirus Bombay]EJN41101.1 hypothetical protein lvs_R598 [Acanthamoeba polyphaga lentillevirus]BAV61822.1 hypothetical protein [Acanthamoeba castellanii mimivirus]
MKFKKFVFKFIDHDKRNFTVVCVNVYANKATHEFAHDNDFSKKLEWKIKHFKHAHALERRIHQLVKETYFRESTGSLDQFADFKSVKVCVKDKIVKINLGENQEGNPVYKQVKSVSKHYHVFVRGTKPLNRREKGAYTHSMKVHDIHLTGNLDQGLEFAELCNFSIPESGIHSVQSQSSVTQSLNGQNVNPGAVVTGGDNWLSATNNANWNSTANTNAAWNSMNRNSVAQNSASKNANNWNSAANSAVKSSQNNNLSAMNNSLYNNNKAVNTNTINSTNNRNVSSQNNANRNASMATTYNNSVNSANSINTANTRSQTGGQDEEDFEKKYKKYKNKYAKLKNQKTSNF